jgi:hypothetical protein
MSQGPLQGLRTVQWLGKAVRARSWMRCLGVLISGVVLIVAMASLAMGSHRGSEEHQVDPETQMIEETVGHAIPDAPFQVFLHEGKGTVKDGDQSQARANEVLKTVVEAFSQMMAHRADYPRFHEALTKEALQKVIIEPKVVNREGKEFLFLVARTSQENQVNLLINASALEKNGYLNYPEQLVPVLAREFQWVVSKADTTPKRQTKMVQTDLSQVPIKTNQEIRKLSGEEREQLVQNLFRTYLSTVDRHASLEGQPYYEIGTTTQISPSQPDSTTKLYDIRVREALQKIVREPYFQEHTPKAVRSLLNGKIWNVAFANIPERDWATRTRVVPQEQSIRAGEHARTIQPAMILINIHRTAAPEDPFYAETNGLPMGALPADKLARVIAREIQDHITEKSMRGHTAEDERTAPP